MKPYQDITDPALAKALAHPLRTRILAALENRTASPSELAEELDASLGVLSYHVRRLTALGFLKLVKRVPRRGAVEHYYTTVARPRITDDAWGATPKIVKEATLRAALDQIGGVVSGAAATGGFDAGGGAPQPCARRRRPRGMARARRGAGRADGTRRADRGGQRRAARAPSITPVSGRRPSS